MLRTRLWLFAAILLIAVASGLLVSVLADRQARLISADRFREDSAVVSRIVVDRINNYTNVLYGARALFSSSEVVTKEEWQEFANSTRLLERYPGLSTFFYAGIVPGTDYDAYVATLPDVIVDWSSGIYEGDNLVISYVFPEDLERRVALGYSIPISGEDKWFTEALNKDVPQISRLTFIEEVSQNYFFALVIPLKNGDVMDTTAGVVGMSFRLNPLFTELFSDFYPRGKMQFTLFDMWDEQLYSYINAESGDDNLAEKKILQQEVLDSLWTFEFEYEPYFGLDEFEKLIPMFLGFFTTMLVIVSIGTIVLFYIIRADQVKERSEKLRAEFISIISHQLRTPMTSIKWTLDMLREDPNLDDKERDKLLTDVYASSQRVIDITNDLLQLSRLETNRQKPPQLDKASINKIISDAITACAGDAKQREIQVLVESQMTDLNYCVDRSQLLQVLTNILGNAVKYSRPNTNVTVKLEEAEKSYNLMVIDNGIGIPRKEMSQLFTKFFRASNAASLNTDGTGIGLFIAKSLAELNGLNILVESNEGSGSIFTIQLPKSTDC